METITENHNESKRRVVEPSPRGHVYNTAPPNEGSANILEEGKYLERLWEPEDQGVHSEIVSSSNVKSYTHKIFSTQLSKYELSKEGHRWTQQDGMLSPRGLNPTERNLSR